MNRRLLAVRLDAQHIQPCVAMLDPYLPHHSAVGMVVPDTDSHKRLLLHPRIDDPARLPDEVRTEVTDRFDARFVPHPMEIAEATWRQLHVVVFASRSREGSPLAPGLSRHWRRYLSNFAQGPRLHIGGSTYATVEHYFQGRKAQCSTHPDMARWFTAEYEGEHRVGPDPRTAKQAGARKGYLAHGAVLDVERWVEIREQVMRTAIEARWAQDERFVRILRSTRGLTLLHFERASARSFWGGALDKHTGQVKGQNRLGTLMMERRDRDDSTPGPSRDPA